jgi:hypothetical protein
MADVKMAINSSKIALQSIRNGVLTNLERQSELLLSTRKAHSHSDDLLPPDLVVDVLAEGTSNIKAYVESEIVKQEEGNQDTFRDIVRRDLFAVECKRYIFEVLSNLTTLDEDEVRHGIRRLFDRFDIILNFDIEDIIEPTLMMSIHEDKRKRSYTSSDMQRTS